MVLRRNGDHGRSIGMGMVLRRNGDHGMSERCYVGIMLRRKGATLPIIMFMMKPYFGVEVIIEQLQFWRMIDQLKPFENKWFPGEGFLPSPQVLVLHAL